MHLACLRLRDFRNYRSLDLDLAPGFHLMLGENAQGKTNVLEAIYLLATLRSFRGAGGTQMVRSGEAGYFVGGRVMGDGARDLSLYWSASKRRITMDQEPIRSLSDFLGCLRAVVFCAEDLQLIKGVSRIRRRFLDFLLTQTEPAYLPLLQRYMRTLRSRNALLKRSDLEPGLMESFSQELIRAGNEIIEWRRRLLPKVSALARLAYRRVSNDAEEFRFLYRPSVRQDFAAELGQSKDREIRYRSTIVGPHRDDFSLLLDGRDAAQFGSEGQKRSAAISLKTAQAEYLAGVLGGPPILLIDDVMGELDLRRRSGLLPLLEKAGQERGQVFMTCTEENWPQEMGRRLHRWRVVGGTVRPAD